MRPLLMMSVWIFLAFLPLLLGWGDMNQSGALKAFLFLIGVVAQALLSMPGMGNILGGLMGLVGMMPGKHESRYDLSFHIVVTAIMFAAGVISTSYRDIMPRLNELLLLSFTMTFWYVMLTCFATSAPWRQYVMYAMLIPTAGVVYIAFIKTQLGFAGKLFFYAWFLLMTLAIALLQFPQVYMLFAVTDSALSREDIWLCVFSGMAFFYVLVNLTCIYEIIPYRSSDKQQRRSEMNELSSMLAEQYNTAPPPLWQTVGMLLAQCAVIYLNIVLHLVADWLLISMLLLGAPIVHGSRLGMRTQEEPEDIP